MYKTIAIVVLTINACHSLTSYDKRIVAGQESDITNSPYQISLQRSNGKHTCGGSILSEKWILTAAHCVHEKKIETRKVIVGTSSISEGGVTHTVKRGIVHERYGSIHTFSHDIALLELDEPIVFTERAKPVFLPRDDEPVPYGKMCAIQGWGGMFSNSRYPDKLRAANLPILSPEECGKIKGCTVSLFEGPEAPMICAGWNHSLPDTCLGDSGGALVCKNIQYGIVSFGYGCANPKYPKVFAHVYNLRDFIYNNTDL